jgi:hypothetical protein
LRGGGRIQVRLINLYSISSFSQQSLEKHRPGPKINCIFEEEVRSLLLYNQLTTFANGASYSTLCSIAFSFNVIESAAKQLQQSDTWKGVKDIAKLGFSNGWIARFLHRQKLTKRVITSKVSVPESMDITNIHKSIEDNEFGEEEVFNADETGIQISLKANSCYLPVNERRAYTEDHDCKLQFTLMVTCSSTGKLMPGFYILKNSCAGTDHSKSTTLKNLKGKINNGEMWSLGNWSRNIEGLDHKRIYLINKVSKTVIVTNPTAWMDKVTLVQYLNLVVQPYLNGKHALIIWDNFAPHCNEMVKSAFKDIGVSIELLPPNTTKELQPLDVTLNGMLKRHIRQRRGMEIIQYMFGWRIKCDKAKEEGKELPPFVIPPSSYHRCILIVEDILNKEFRAPEFMKSMSETFVSCGIRRAQDGKYKEKFQGQVPNINMVEELCEVFADINVDV